MAVLVSGGHRWPDIQNYTLEQIALFYAAVVKARVEYMLDVRMAVWGDKETLGKHIESIGGR